MKHTIVAFHLRDVINRLHAIHPHPCNHVCDDEITEIAFNNWDLLTVLVNERVYIEIEKCMSEYLPLIYEEEVHGEVK
jgi:hypothetical protein